MWGDYQSYIDQNEWPFANIGKNIRIFGIQTDNPYYWCHLDYKILLEKYPGKQIRQKIHKKLFNLISYDLTRSIIQHTGLRYFFFLRTFLTRFILLRTVHSGFTPSGPWPWSVGRATACWVFVRSLFIGCAFQYRNSVLKVIKFAQKREM